MGIFIIPYLTRHNILVMHYVIINIVIVLHAVCTDNKYIVFAQMMESSDA